MFPIQPTTGMQAEALGEQPAAEDEHQYAQRHGRVMQLPARQAHSPSRARLVLLASAVIITLALLAAFA